MAAIFVLIIFIVMAVVLVSAASPKEYIPDTTDTDVPPYWRYTKEASSRHQQAIRKGENGVVAGVACLLVILVLVLRAGGCTAQKTPSYGSENNYSKQK